MESAEGGAWLGQQQTAGFHLIPTTGLKGAGVCEASLSTGGDGGPRALTLKPRIEPALALLNVLPTLPILLANQGSLKGLKTGEQSQASAPDGPVFTRGLSPFLTEEREASSLLASVSSYVRGETRAVPPRRLLQGPEKIHAIPSSSGFVLPTGHVAVRPGLPGEEGLSVAKSSEPEALRSC